MSYLDLVSLEKLEMAPAGFKPTVIVKVGTSSVMRERQDNPEAWNDPATAAGEGLNSSQGELALSTLALIVDTLIALKRAGFWVVLVTSGAVGVGCRRLGIKTKPSRIAEKQALAAVGMGKLMHHYEELFAVANESTALVLVSRSDFGKRSKFINIRNTLHELLKLGVIPIINENDTVASNDFKFGDNDRLSALVAGMLFARYLFLLTDVDRLYTADPRDNPSAKPIETVVDLEELDLNVDSSGKGGTQWGTGGMETKLAAARLATAGGSKVVIIHGRKPERILDFVLERENKIGTVFLGSRTPVSTARKLWILHGLVPSGGIEIDAGAVRAVINKKSLFAVGVKKIVGTFFQDGAIRLYNKEGSEIGRAISNYDSSDLMKILGSKSNQIEDILGNRAGPEEVVHRDNLVLF
uniref:PUA domain-containing protein n=1 Tax=Rhodosorus marinus TaxID=101924 RepID=A0A7S2ZSR4_9RHOD|mmetsp:Transcript_29669/g.114234  ORF Transcript_29669/g.114234 Transcript_29669/m.114234 type:complete len:412 (+) Transcript_29669:237-1472(+)|eukprot:CAMPEP_0113961630 /NCGR_PEP_ID=MMETSP0011_2-20120614/5425_1 /TAXON_ID=101924 /ORGANISM="Rhodosorus marinus" /LENGTH=411 /DNA_ID=CAMNT_0000973311 /DNA_START=66 /DNA_END=1301 /DNA_ORIENTATION=+ /assembly_acc=CAM_ASM_000156